MYLYNMLMLMLVHIQLWWNNTQTEPKMVMNIRKKHKIPNRKEH